MRQGAKKSYRHKLLILFSLLSFLYLALGISLAFQLKTISEDLKQIQITKDFQKLSKDISRLSSSAQNPIWYPIFWIVGTPETLNHGKAALSNFDSVLKDLEPTLIRGNDTWMSQLQKSAPILDSSQGRILATLDNLRQLHFGGLLSPFDSKLNSVREKANASYIAASNFLPIISKTPALIGIANPRKYLIAFQNPAESRATGGIIGAYAIVSFTKGKLQILHIGSNAELISASTLPIRVPREYIDLYGNDPAIWQNSNLSAHYPYAARIWLALWERSIGSKLDGVITLDPIVLQQILSKTGPVVVGQEKISSENVLEKTMSEAYIKYAKDNDARKRYLVSIIKAVFQQIKEHPLKPSQMLDAMKGPLEEHRILFYSVHDDEEGALVKSDLGGALSSRPDNKYRLIINNFAGNKMDYYLNRAVTITTLSCGKNRLTQVDYTLQNNVDKDVKLPPYVNGRLDLDKPDGLGNSTYVEALLIGPYGSRLIGALNDNTDGVAGSLATELGHPVLVTNLELAPKNTIHITAKFRGGFGPITNYIQPLVQPMTVKITDKCNK